MSTTSTPTAAQVTLATEVVLPGVVEPDGLVVRRRELPAPAAGQALVAVEASGVSFAEQQMRRGKYYDQPPFPFVPGYDLVGTVTAVGPDVDPALVGQRVPHSFPYADDHQPSSHPSTPSRAPRPWTSRPGDAAWRAALLPAAPVR